jgi:hypothetical protein
MPKIHRVFSCKHSPLEMPRWNLRASWYSSVSPANTHFLPYPSLLNTCSQTFWTKYPATPFRAKTNYSTFHRPTPWGPKKLTLRVSENWTSDAVTHYPRDAGIQYTFIHVMLGYSIHLSTWCWDTVYIYPRDAGIQYTFIHVMLGYSIHLYTWC